MRSFPRTLPATLPASPRRFLGRRLTAALVAAVLATGGAGVSGLDLARADDLKDKQKQVEHELEAAHGDLEEASDRARRTAARLEAAQARLSTARDALAAARAKVAAARIRDRQMQERLDAAVARLQAARADVAAGRLALSDQRADVASLISDIYQQGDPRLLAFAGILNSQSPADLTRQMEAQNIMVSTETHAYDALRAAEVLLTVREGQVTQAKQETAARRREAAARLAETRAAEQEAAAAEAGVRASVADSRAARAAAVAARRADLRKLQELKKEQERIEQLLRRRATARNPDAPTGGYLDYPAGGTITSPFGYRTHPIYGYWGLHDGIDFGAGCGTPMRAGASGTVLSAYWSDVYGNRLILDHGVVHGVGLASIYNHAIRYTVGVGEHVDRGEVIGYVGTTGWSTGCHLHFTVMVNGKAVDPMGWM